MNGRGRFDRPRLLSARSLALLELIAAVRRATGYLQAEAMSDRPGLTVESAETSYPRCREPARVELHGLAGLRDFHPGDDLAGAIVDAARQSGVSLASGDIVVVAQKVVSKCEGAFADLSKVIPSPDAWQIANRTGKDPRLVEVVLGETREVLRAAPGVLIVANHHGHVMANAGVDASNIEPALGERVLKLPVDPDRSALQLKINLQALAGVDVAVVINDSWGRAWRNGTVGHAIGCAGFPALWDRRGEPDMFGRTLQATEIGLADEIAAAASLVMGAGAERLPVVIVRGVKLPAGEGSARDLIRDKRMDLFR